MRWSSLFPICLAAVAAQAATYTWTGAAGDGQVANPANWLGGQLPPPESLILSGNTLTVLSPEGTPNTFVLNGNAPFSGKVNIDRSIVRLDAPLAFPNSTVLSLVGPGYIGATENLNLNTAGFLGRLGMLSSASAIVGFDTASSSGSRTITEAVDLSAGGTRFDSFYLGTSTKATLSGTITPTVGDGLYFTAIRGGELTIASTLGPTLPSVTLGQQNPFDPQTGTVRLTGNNTYSGGTYVLGGTASAGANSALGTGLVNVSSGATLAVEKNITFSNALTLTDGARLSGTGTFATPQPIVIQNGTILSPGGSAAIGTLTFGTPLVFGSGGQFDFNISSALPGGTGGWDRIFLPSQTLMIDATAANPFTFNLISLTPSSGPGALVNFDATQAYSWTVSSAGQIFGFNDPAQFAFNTTQFSNALAGGNFFIGQNGNNLTINFTPVPEPSTYALLALGLGALGYSEYRRRRKI